MTTTEIKPANPVALTPVLAQATPLTPKAPLVPVANALEKLVPKVVAKRVIKKLDSIVKAPTRKVAKPLLQTPVKTPTKPTPKASSKVAVKATAKPLAKTVDKAKAEKSVKEKKPKLVRDSFTIPKVEYTVLDDLKQRAGKLAKPIKKSELIRAGIKALAAMSDAAFLATLKTVPAIKTGRPAKD